MKIISKSKFVSGSQCLKKLHFDFYRKDLKSEVTTEQQARFDAGHEIGKLAQQVFPNGNDATENFDDNWGLAIKRTTEWIASGIQTIYEASFSHSGGFAALDILHQTPTERWAIEVKSSAELKDYYFTDAAFQYWVLDKCGVKPDRFFLMHLNENYTKIGNVNPEELFVLTDITEQILKLQDETGNKLERFQTMLLKQEEPSITIGKHCNAMPYECSYKHHCWQHIPENSVFELYRGGQKSWSLFDKGIIQLAEIPEDEKLSKRQELQVNGIKFNQEFKDKKGITNFVNSLKYPLYFFDFETIAPAIPILDGTRPFEKVPFQYSLHILSAPNAPLVHKEFIANPNYFNTTGSIDPRLQLLNQLMNDIGPDGSILVYYAPFEKGVLNLLKKGFPNYAQFINGMLERIMDLHEPFKEGLMYLPSMGKSASIKYVLPALAPEFSYANLEINNGNLASTLFLEKVKGIFSGNWKKTHRHLLDYCERDTLGMVVLYEKLLEETK